MGFLVSTWPIVLGCDAGGVVVEVGPEVSRLKTGDEVCGCTRLGIPGHSTFQEYVSERLRRALKSMDVNQWANSRLTVRDGCPSDHEEAQEYLVGASGDTRSGYLCTFIIKSQ